MLRFAAGGAVNAINHEVNIGPEYWFLYQY